MKKSILAMLLVLCCTLSLLGCENQVKVKEKETKPVAETESVEGTEKQEIADEDAVLGVPGSPDLPAVQLFDLTYGKIKDLEWEEIETTEQENGTWLCTAMNKNVEYTFVFENPYQSDDVTAQIMTVSGDGSSCITDRNSIGDTLDVFPDDIQEQVTPLDGILYTACKLEGKNTELQFDGDTTELIAVQFQREAK